MACAQWEDSLAAYAELSPEERASVDCHLPACAACREYLDVMRALDAAMTREYAGVSFRVAMRERPATPRVSAMPEVLDFIGCAALLLVAMLFAWKLIPHTVLTDSLDSALGWSVPVAALAFAAALWTGLRVHHELRH